MSEVIKNVFVSHHHKDDSSVDGLTSLVARKGYNLRNSSIRVKPENQSRLDKNKVSDRTIERLLRRKMRWAGQLIVLIGKETHTRPWVNWEIKVANQLGMQIIGVYERGLKDKVEIPENLKEYGQAAVPWIADSVIAAMNGESQFQNPDGSPWPKGDGGNIIC
ncbi:MAG: TIR domain-containing protein [Mariprofundus sp.]|nr:TIR domain-containing protein [Mariprofundus sp.]